MKKFISILAITLACVSCEQGLNLSVPLVKDVPTGSGSGNPLVPDNKIEFTMEQLKLPMKKGAGIGIRKSSTDLTPVNLPKLLALNAGWNYHWGPEIHEKQPSKIEFLPMIWWEKTGFDTNLGIIRNQLFAGRIKKILAFNEPDAKEQGNVTVAEAIARWPQFQSLRIPIGSPAVASQSNGWLEDFMRIAAEKEYRVDYICVHTYPGGRSAAGTKKLIESTWAKYKKPILLTEFAIADWNVKTGDPLSKNKLKPADALAYMKDILPWLEEQEYVLGYCWFPFSTTSPWGWPAALFNEDGTLTELGKYYSEFKSK